METARKKGLVFNSDKCSIKTPEIQFYGMVYSSQGVRPDWRKTQEIAKLPSPTSVKELQQFLGMVQYLAPFIPKLSEYTASLRGLLKKESQWYWTPDHEKQYCKIKELICNTVTLNYFNPQLETIVQVDASQRGLGAALLQKDKQGKTKVIAFASKALTPVEERYSCGLWSRKIPHISLWCTFHSGVRPQTTGKYTYEKCKPGTSQVTEDVIETPALRP
jgi:hypothetical protein